MPHSSEIKQKGGKKTKTRDKENRKQDARFKPIYTNYYIH